MTTAKLALITVWKLFVFNNSKLIYSTLINKATRSLTKKINTQELRQVNEQFNTNFNNDGNKYEAFKTLAPPGGEERRQKTKRQSGVELTSCNDVESAPEHKQ